MIVLRLLDFKTAFTTRRSCRSRLYTATEGQGIIEMIASLLMFMLLISLVVNISTYLYVQHSMVTAAREGARVASLNEDIGSPSSASSGITDVRDHVIDMVSSTTGITLANNNITVTPPDPSEPTGERTVSVEISMTFDQILPSAEFASAISQSSVEEETPLLHAEATMHYEE